MTLVDPAPSAIQPGPARVTRHWRGILAWLAVAPLVLWVLMRLTGTGNVFPIIQLLAFTPYVLLAGLVVALFVGLLRRWVPLAVALVAVLALAAAVLPRSFGGADAEAGGPHLRVLSANMRFGSSSAQNLVTLVREHNVDVLALQEFSPGAQRRLRAAGLDSLLPYSVTRPDDQPDGSAVYSRYPITDQGYLHRSVVWGQAYGVLNLPTGERIRVESAHPPAPAVPNSSTDWRTGQRDQPDPADFAGATILVGDFNATLDHAPLRALLGTGYTDVASHLGDGLTPTWPYDGRPVPRVTLDHVLVSAGVRAYAFHTYANPGSDHRAIYAEVGLPKS